MTTVIPTSKSIIDLLLPNFLPHGSDFQYVCHMLLLVFCFGYPFTNQQKAYIGLLKKNKNALLIKYKKQMQEEETKARPCDVSETLCFNLTTLAS